MQTVEFLLSTYDNMLGALDGWLAKAEADPRGDALLSERLADDMFSLARQVRFVCNLPGEAMARVAGIDFVSSDEDDTTLAAARERIATVRAQIGGWKNAPFQADEAPVELSLPNGMVFDLDTRDYARDWALPQFYFHTTTAYAILRAAGLELGKADYVPHMTRYFRTA